MPDEAHFHLNGFINKQNFRYWIHTNPIALHEQPLHCEKVTAWCLQFLLQGRHLVSTRWGYGPYTAIVEEFFPGCIISRFGDINWPARSSNLTAPDFFLWGHLKAKVFQTRPHYLGSEEQNTGWSARKQGNPRFI